MSAAEEIENKRNKGEKEYTVDLRKTVRKNVKFVHAPGKKNYA